MVIVIPGCLYHQAVLFSIVHLQVDKETLALHMWPPNGTKGVQEPSDSSMPQRYLCEPAPARPPAVTGGRPAAATVAAAHAPGIECLGNDDSGEEEEANGPGGSAGGGDKPGLGRHVQVSCKVKPCLLDKLLPVLETMGGFWLLSFGKHFLLGGSFLWGPGIVACMPMCCNCCLGLPSCLMMSLPCAGYYAV